VVLIGTNHTIQRDRGRTDFTQYVDESIRKNGVKSVAEEINVETSTSDIAREIGLEYLVIEPTPEERVALEIPSLGQIENSIFMDFDDPNSLEAKEELSKRKENSYRTREEEWLKRINTLQASPTLIICGAHHFSSFKTLLQQNGYEVIDECPIWQ